MITSHIRARQPLREPWSRERLVRERAIALGQAIDISTWNNYGSALNSYLSFIRMHNLPVEPTADTLSLYTVYMCHHIKPGSVDTYLSGICQQLEPYFPSVRDVRKSRLVHRTLQGCKRLRGTPTTRKRALTIDDLSTVYRLRSIPDTRRYSLLHSIVCWFLRANAPRRTHIPRRSLSKRSPQTISADVCCVAVFDHSIFLAWP